MIINQADLKKIVNLDGQTCFGCGEKNPHGLHMHFLTDEQRVYSFVTVPTEMAGWDQTVHGGVISTILDEIMGWTVIYLLQKIGVTKSITVDFLKPVHVGKPLTVVGAIEATRSERQVMVSGAIYDDGDALCAKATGDFAAMPAKTAVRLGVMRSDYMERFLPVLQQKQGTN